MHFKINENQNICSIISQAIAEKKQIRFNYKSEGMRKVNPHAMFTNHKGNTLVDGLQVSGFTNSSLPNWKQFNLNSISDIIIQVDSFEVNELFNRNSGRYIKALIMVKD